MLIPINTNVNLLVQFGASRIGKTVQYRILSYDGTELEVYTAVGVVEIGVGVYSLRRQFTSAFQGIIQWKDLTDLIYAAESLNVVADYIGQINNIFLVETGTWRIINNQMILYAADSVTPIYTFDLKDVSDNPTSDSPTQRVVV